MKISAQDLSIGTVAARSGVPAAVLRSWQDRFGFPSPRRTPAGHRRYSDEDVRRIRQVIDARAAGLSLEAAIKQVGSTPTGGHSSIFEGVRRRHPELPVNRWPAKVMLAVSRAVEDECLVAGRPALLIGSFQRAAAFRHAERRWRDAAGSAGRILVFADFPEVREDGIVTQIRNTAALHAEWAVICASPSFAAYVGGRQLPGQTSTGPTRQFEATWTVDADVVRSAVQVGLELAAVQGNETLAGAGVLEADLPEATSAAVQRAVAVLNRTITRLART